MNSTFLSLGSNLGNKLAHFSSAENYISKNIGCIVMSSSVYETEPWGYTQQAAFLNKVIQVETILNPHELLKAILNIEFRMGRIKTHRWHERIIDIDILFFNDLIMKEVDLVIPHPLMHERKFVLMPLVEIASIYIHPIINKTSKSLLAECADPLMVKKIA